MKYSWFMNLIKMPVFQDDDMNRKVKVINKLVKGIMFSMFFIWVAILLIPEGLNHWIALFVYVQVLSILVLGFVRKGYVSAAARLLVAGLGVLLAYLSLTTGGVQSPSYMSGTMVVVMLAGILLGKKTSIITIGFFLSLGLCLTALEGNGMLPRNSVQRSSLSFVLGQFLYYTIIYGFYVVFEWSNRTHLENIKTEIYKRAAIQIKLNEAEQIYFSIFKFGPMAVAISQKDSGKLMQVNNEFCRMVGYYTEELFEKNTIELGLWVNENDRLRLVQNLKDNHDSIASEVELRTKTGETVKVILSMASINIDDEECIISMMLDISDRIRAEDEIRRLNVELESRVAERTEQLHKAYSELEGYSYTISHDMKVPLRAIDGYSRILLEDYGEGLEPEGREMIENVRKICSDMIIMINKLLEYSKMGNDKLQLEKVDFNDLIWEVFKEQQITSGSSKASQIELVLDGKLPQITVDQTLIRIALTNMVSNAIKFTKSKESAAIHVGVIENGNGTVFYIKDNGVGFNMKYAGKLFNVFQRLHNSKDYEGSGIGLATVKKIIEHHQGQVWIEGEPGIGTTVYFTIGTDQI